MFTDPQTLSPEGSGASDYDVARVNQDNFKSEYRAMDGDDEIQFLISHGQGKVSGGGTGKSHTSKIIRKVYDVNGVASIYTTWFTFHVPSGGSEVTAEKDVDTLRRFLSDTAVIKKLINMES